jgi:hypothetical protein
VADYAYPFANISTTGNIYTKPTDSHPNGLTNSSSNMQTDIYTDMFTLFPAIKTAFKSTDR